MGMMRYLLLLVRLVYSYKSGWLLCHACIEMFVFRNNSF